MKIGVIGGIRVCVGDAIQALGHDIGNYHHWKSQFDGGRVIPNGGEE